MARADGDRKRITAGALDEFLHILRARIGRILGLDLDIVLNAGQRTELCLHDGAVCVRIFHDLARQRDIFLKRLGRSVDHNRRKAVIDTGLAQLKRVPVVQMETDRQAGFDHGGFHQLDQVRTVGILARAGRYLQDHRRVALLGSLRDALNDLHIVHVEGANGIAACIRFCKHFLRSYNRH